MAEQKPQQASYFRNWISSIGAFIALVSLANIVFLIFAEVSTGHGKPYLGVLAYMVLPAVMVFGLLLFFAGAIIERWRRSKRSGGAVTPYPRLDLNDPRQRRTVLLAAIGGAAFIFISMAGSYRAYEYTDSDEFCGQLCHEVMHPEYTAYLASPHARVGCVDCHVGTGATWYVRSKLSGAYQVYAATFNKFPRPIPTPVENLRPAQQTCEQCHWPEKFWGGQLKTFTHYGYDEQNTARETQLLIKTGGGSPTTGPVAGIHWHMNIANEITYVATDRQRQNIPWVQLRDRNGVVTEFMVQDSGLTREDIEKLPKRRMDCVDCHNRPTHIYVPPDQSVDRALRAGLISATLPYIKQQAVETLTREYQTSPEAVAQIEKDLLAYYSQNYPDVFRGRRADVDQAVAQVRQIFQTTIFPEMKVDWRTHPDNVSHFYFPGCFRCHTDQHVSADGKAITKECSVCHEVLSQQEAGVSLFQKTDLEFQHPVELGDLRDYACSDCHSGGASP
jgi:hypothetical protein